MIRIEKIAVGFTILLIYTVGIIFTILTYQQNQFPINMILSFVSGIMGTIAIIFYGFE